jgi:SET domain-containing protein
MSKNDVLVYVADSPIHGKGLFAKRTISAGEIIGVIQGVPASVDGAHVLWVDDKHGVQVQCDLRYINHSDKPNAVYYDTLEVCALRDIVPGEEITHNYDGD